MKINERVRVYRNLNKGGLSIQTKTEKGWKVTEYALFVTLKNCTYKVREGGRQKVLKDRQKNVHAWVEGDLESKDEKSYLESGYSDPYYNPYTQGFFTINGEKVYNSVSCRIFSPPKGVRIKGKSNQNKQAKVS